jgi:predicted dehydrogenase
MATLPSHFALPPTDFPTVRWGVLGAANIAIKKVIPAMQASGTTPVVAIASRDLSKAREAAEELGIEKAYGSYEELLADPGIDVIYNPLPNHLHVPWSVRAAEAGKHVLCEKPVGLTAAEARMLLGVRDRTGVRIGEAFMARTHPQWQAVRELVDSGRIGELRLITGHFSYFKDDPTNIRSRPEFGGGALMDIGCYPVTLSRLVYRSEPSRVMAAIERHPVQGVDRLTSAVMEFPTGQATFTCSMQLVPHQRMQMLGTTGRIEVEIPFNAPSDERCRLFVDDGSDLRGGGVETIEVRAVDQYALQAQLFAAAVRGRGEVPVPLEDAVRNMAVIDALFRSAESGRWETPER